MVVVSLLLRVKDAEKESTHDSYRPFLPFPLHNVLSALLARFRPITDIVILFSNLWILILLYVIYLIVNSTFFSEMAHRPKPFLKKGQGKYTKVGDWFGI